METEMKTEDASLWGEIMETSDRGLGNVMFAWEQSQGWLLYEQQ